MILGKQNARLTHNPRSGLQAFSGQPFWARKIHGALAKLSESKQLSFIPDFGETRVWFQQ
jgi:hypothetical protein